MSRSLSYLIVGNGIAGATAAEVLRAQDPTCSITMVAEDPFPVYYRPALKDYLAGQVPEEKLWARPRTFYQEQQIRFVPGRVFGVAPQRHLVTLAGGVQLGYDRLLLAGGARARTLSCPGIELAGVSTLRTVRDYQSVLEQIQQPRRVVVCGSGTLALETAEVLNRQGHEVVHLLRFQTLWSEVLDATASDLVLQEERRAGIEVRTGEAIAEIVGRQGSAIGVITSSGAQIACDLVLIAIGIEPATEMLHNSGIAFARGVQVDAQMRTNQPDVFAAGDIIEVSDPITGQTRVPGQWYPAVQQARIAAFSMLGRTHEQPDGGPYYNATALHGLDFAAIGLTVLPREYLPYFQQVVAPPASRSYRKVVLQDGVPFGALFLGNRRHALAFKRAIDHRVNLTPVAAYLFADEFDLDVWLDHQQVPAAHLNAVEPLSSESLQTAFYRVVPVQTHSTSPYTKASQAIPSSLLKQLQNVPSLVLMAQNGIATPVQLGDRRLTLGRGQECDIVLADTAVSRNHAEIYPTPDGFFIRDLGSSYGVLVNKTKISAPYCLSHSDCIVLGNTLIYCWLPQSSQSGKIPAQSGKHPAQRSSSPTHPAYSITHKLAAISLGHRPTMEPMSTPQLNFEMDMCIGCDRCMAACPVPLSSQVSIADLNSSTLAGTIAPHVARFTHECILCGSCVPVCPVDNHRDLMMLSLKQRLGSSWDEKADISRIENDLPERWNVARLLSLLRMQPIFHNIQHENYLLHLCAAARLLALEPGSTVIKEGEYGRELYFVLEGQVEIATTEGANQELPLALLGPGEHFGEDGMLTGQPYNITARTPAAGRSRLLKDNQQIETTVLLQVPEQTMQRYMELVPQARQHFESLNVKRSVGTLLSRLALFQGVAAADLNALIEQTLIKHYDRDERLFAEGVQDVARPARETLHLLLEGFVKVVRRSSQPGLTNGERIIAYRQRGDYFAGGLDLLGDGRAVSVTAINRTRVAEISRAAMLSLFRRYPEVEQRFSARLLEYVESSASAYSKIFQPGELLPPSMTGQLVESGPADPAIRAGLHALVSDGVVEGTEVLVIDLDKCIHCAECEEACKRRHGHSRMNRKGMIVGNISIATACRQCQDPVCMLCSRAGIIRLPNGEVSITENCIGCGICAERCPYGAISIIDVDEMAEDSRTWKRFSQFFTHSSPKPKRAQLPMLSVNSDTPLDEMRKKLAIKCDLCAGYSNQACIQACPTGAAIRVQPTKFFGSTEQILQRRAQ